MKKFLLLITMLFTWMLAFSQVDVNQLFSQHPEVIIKFQINDRSQLETLTRMVSIDKIFKNEVVAYTTKEEFEQFLTLNIPFEIVEKLVLTPEELNMLDFDAIQKCRNNWDYYPTYQGYLDMMAQFAIDYPNLCRVKEFGTSVQGRKLLACVVSKNVNIRENEPQVFLSSSMHGDELTGYVLMLRYIDYLLTNYGNNPKVTHLLDNLEIWINPLANPDGTFITGNSSVSGAIRNNANNKDLNRNYPDDTNGGNPPPGYGPIQPETAAFIALQQAESFTLAVNIHGGAEVANYPWDNKTAQTAYHAWWIYVCREYVDTVQYFYPTYMKGTGVAGNQNGIVWGWQWYQVYGGRQDYANYYDHTREFCLEISNTKTPTGSQLPNYWNAHYRSFLNYTQQALYGIHGIVTDACSGEHIYAKISIPTDLHNSFVMTDLRTGYYARYFKAGTYSVTYSADGYIPQTVSITVADRQKVVQNIELSPVNSPPLPPVTDFVADKTIIIETGETVKIKFTDLSTNCTDNWKWYFEGGTPETSTLQNPVISYNAKKLAKARFLDVKLVSGNVHGKDSIYKEGYIKIGLPPNPEFDAEPKTIVANHSVSFTDMTENEPASWTWHFEGGIPETSQEQHPTVVYKQPGIYSVELTAKNIFGEKSITKENLITVTETELPVADFIAETTHITTGESVQFTNLSLNADTWEWYFEGGIPETSNDENPIVVYENAGSFNVKLTVSNAEASDSLLRENYIVVEDVAIGEMAGLKVKVFPNPVSQGATITIDADATLRKIEWLNLSGATVKTMYADATSYTFTVSGVEQGFYLLKIETEKGISITKIQVQ